MRTSRNTFSARLLVGLSALALVFTAFASTSSAQDYGTDDPQEQIEYTGNFKFEGSSVIGTGGFGQPITATAGDTPAPPAETSGSEIAFTGSSSNLLASGAIALIAVGGAAVIASRRSTSDD